MLDSGAHFYEVYETKDGGHVSMYGSPRNRLHMRSQHLTPHVPWYRGAIEPQFYAELLQGMGLADDDSLPAQMDSSAWPAMKDKFAAVFKSKTRDEWCVRV